MKLLLLGKDGQVGAALRPLLSRLGELVALGHGEADFEQPGELPRLVALHAPDVIVNAVAYTAVDRAEGDADRARLVNAEAVAALAVAAQRSGAWLVHYSTDYVFDGAKPEPYDETDEAHPLSVYGATKLKGDREIAASGCRHLIFRVSWVYSSGRANFPASILRLARERTALNVVADQVGAPTSAGLIAATTVAAIEALWQAGSEAGALAGTYHLAPQGAVSRYDFARFLVAEARARGAELALAQGGLLPIGSADYPTPAARPLNSRLSTTKLQSVFGFEPPPWEEDARRWVAGALGEGVS
jgi:dTDP-4-dehydrorhamnose reductase